jgi:hypothetical protein
MRVSTLRGAAVGLFAIAALTLSACNSASSGSAPGMLPQQSAMSQTIGGAGMGADAAKKLAPITTSPGAVIGEPNKFSPSSGDYPSGGHGKVVDGVPCHPMEYLNDYHVHAYFGLIVNGKQIAIPSAVGLMGPSDVTNGFINKAKCFYYIHTHDSSGIIHIEDPQKLPYSAQKYTMSSVLKVWGVPYSTTSFGPFKGKMHVFVGNVPTVGETKVTKYALFTGGLQNVKLYSHTAVWVVIGEEYASAKKLPAVNFYMEY